MPISKVQAEQIFDIFTGLVAANAFPSTAASSANFTVALGTALSTAGRLGTTVLTKVSTSDNVDGVITINNAAQNRSNRVEIVNSTTKLKIADVGGNEVYGRITEAAGVYTLSYYSLIVGVETAYTFAATNIDVIFPYNFLNEQKPAGFATTISSIQVNNDVKLPFSGVKRELLTVSADNVVTNLTSTPAAGIPVNLIVNGVTYTPLGGTPAFSVAGLVVTWSAVNAGFSILLSNPQGVPDLVEADYYIA